MPDAPTTEYEFPDGHEGQMIRWSISEGAVYKAGRRVLTLSRVRDVALNNLNGRVNVREVRLRLDDGEIVTFGSYNPAAFGGTIGDYDAFRDAFFLALNEVSPDVPVNTEIALLPKFSFALFVLGMGLLFSIIGLSKTNLIVILLGVAVAVLGAARAFQHRPWDASRHLVSVADVVPSNEGSAN